MDKFEKLVQEIMRDAEKENEPLTREEAIEMAKMELGTKEIKRYEQSIEQKKKQRKPKTIKISDEKISLFNTILTNLDRNEFIEHENITVIKKNKLIQVKINDKTFKIDIIQQRK